MTHHLAFSAPLKVRERIEGIYIGRCEFQRDNRKSNIKPTDDS